MFDEIFDMFEKRSRGRRGESSGGVMGMLGRLLEGEFGSDSRRYRDRYDRDPDYRERDYRDRDDRYRVARDRDYRYRDDRDRRADAPDWEDRDGVRFRDERDARPARAFDAAPDRRDPYPGRDRADARWQEDRPWRDDDRSFRRDDDDDDDDDRRYAGRRKRRRFDFDFDSDD